MEFQQLVTFQRVATVLSFTRAAADLNYAQSSVTNQIRNLESSLQTELFDRLGSKIQLTDAGQRLLQHTEKLLAMADEARADVAGPAEPSGTLTIGTMESITSYRLPPLLELFHYRYPAVHLALRPSLCADTCRALRQGTFDVGFLMEPDTGHAGLDSVVLAKERLVLVAAPSFPLASAPAVTIEALRKVPVLATESGCSYRDLFEIELTAEQLTPASFLEFGTIEAIKRGVIAGLGVSLLPEITVADEIASGVLKVLPWTPPFEVVIQLAWRRGKRLSRELQLFIDQTIRLVREETPAA
ncbi:DNA-binding transcriptional LysR family regulator [Catenulispora sp. MAP12-49]|uniref:LysR family transcriptional regulator n=1 Tax=unclassified Catenulispora TaxID=414885 RepID=UPI0035122530